MNKIIHFYKLLILLLLQIFIFSACSDEKETELDNIPNGWKQTEDYDKLATNYLYLYRSETDSIKLTFHKAYNEIFGSFSYKSYKKNKRGEFILGKSKYFEKATTLQSDNNQVKLYLFNKYKKEEYFIDFKILDDQRITIKDIPYLSFQDEIEFHVLKRITNWGDKSLLRGGWYNTQLVDSTVLVFEKDQMKEYLFLKGTSTLLDMWNHGDYYASSEYTYLKDELIGIEGNFRFEEAEEVKYYDYRIKNNKLIIEWDSDKDPIVYTPIK